MSEPTTTSPNLDGTWALVHIEQGGVVGNDPNVRLLVAGQRFSLFRQGVLSQTGELLVGPGPGAWNIPYPFEVADDLGPVYPGIMDTSWGHLRYCVAMPGTPIPTTWLDSKGPGQITCIYTRCSPREENQDVCR